MMMMMLKKSQMNFHETLIRVWPRSTVFEAVWYIIFAVSVCL